MKLLSLAALAFAGAFSCRAAILFTVTNPAQTFTPVCSFTDNDCRDRLPTPFSGGPVLTFLATAQNTGDNPFTIAAVENEIYFSYYRTTPAIGLTISPHSTLAFTLMRIELLPIDNYYNFPARSVSVALIGSNPAESSNYQTITYGYNPEPATLMPVAAVIAAGIWHRRKQKGRPC